VADRVAENPTSAEWIDDGRIVYLTDRAGGLAVWYIVLEDNSMVPLTAPLMERSLAPLALDTYGQRTIVPRHVVDSDIQSSSGAVLVNSAQLEYAPAISTRGDRIAYTVAHDGVTEIWVADADGSNPKYLARGQYPRFAPNGNEIVYSNTDLDGNRDIWKADLRTGLQVRLTDDAGMDDTPDWAPDGRSIVFSSERGGQNSLWTIPPDGGQRLKLGGEAGLHGYAPRFSADGARIAYWDRGQVWSARADGTGAVAVAQVAIPTFSGWSGTVLAFVSQGRIMGAGGVETFDSPDRVWGGFDLLPDGSWLVSTVRIERTELLAIDLTFTDQ
jgi:Tol biopolymer transport system component